MKFVDLFSGIGGFHLAAEEALGNSAKCVGFSEIDPLCEKIYRAALAIGDHVASGDIRTLVSEGKDEWGLPQFDLCLAGFPCQPFSNVGKRKAFGDERGGVFFDLLRVLRYYSPSYVILENVEKIKTIQNGAVLGAIEAELSAIGYDTDTFFLCAKDYGLPQQRKRMFICGRKRRRGFRSRLLAPPPIQTLEEAQYPTTWHLLERSMPERHIVPFGSRQTIFTRNEKWMGDLEIDRAIARPLCATMGKWHRANQDNYYTRHYIYSKSGTKPKHFNYKEDEVRRLLPLEALRLQGFPDRYWNYYTQLRVAPTPAFRTIGNAVPVSMAAAVVANLIN